MFQPRLNVAWLPPELVFIRVIHLPEADFAETQSMVDLQLEKISPMPVAQIVWSMHVLEQRAAGQQTIIVMLAARSAVEDYLGRLEGQGYMADRLEMPALDQLCAVEPKADGAWVIPEAGMADRAVVAWWYGRVLRNVDLLTLPPSDRPVRLREELLQMGWAGELEGWIASPPQWHLVASGGAQELWEPPLREGLDQPIEVQAPLKPEQLAAATARRAMHADSRSNLLPQEYATRYQAQFVDRLWMRGVGAIILLYMMGVAVYMGFLQVKQYQTRKVENEVASLSNTYTNAIQLRDRYQVLKDREELKFAALDCWQTTAALLPDEVTLDRMNFKEGRKLTLSGTVPNDKVSALIDFVANMRKASIGGQAMFDASKGEDLQYRAAPGGNAYTWSFGLELKRAEVQ